MKKGKVLAIDYGTRRIGLASGDFEFKIAFPRDILKNNEGTLAKILDICEELEVSLVVIGLPLNMHDEHEENPVLKEVEIFADKIRAAGYEVELIDERLSSFEASHLAAKGDRLDAHAAQVILQRYFDAS